MGATHYECAYYARQVYENGGGRPLNGWFIAESYYPPDRWNLGMAIYINRQKQAIIIAFRGTNGIFDVIADYGTWRRQIHPNQEHVERVATENIDIADENLRGYINNMMGNMDQLIDRHDSSITSSLTRINSTASDMYSKFSITLTGHSIGGHKAEMAACRLYKDPKYQGRIEAVTFESPGFYEIALRNPDYRCESYDFITSYLAAPNIINCLHGHGEEKQVAVRRLYAPHTPSDNNGEAVSWTWGHAFSSLAQGAGRLAITGLFLGGALSGGAPITHLAAGIGGMMVLGGTAAFIIDSLLIRDLIWLKYRQHSMDAILKCFDPNNGYAKSYSEVESWPKLLKIATLTPRVITNLMRSMMPARNDTKGIRMIFWENEMIENQIVSLPGFKTGPIFGDDVAWARRDKSQSSNSNRRYQMR